MEGPRIGFTGHQALTDRTETLIAEALKIRLAGLTRPIGVCSLAAGSDQLFAQAILAAGGQLVVVVPCHGYETSFDDPAALDSYRALLANASDVIELPHDKPSEEAFWDAGQRVVEESQRVLAVWDGQPAGGLGGTADVVRFAGEQHKPVEIIWPQGASRS